MTKKKKIGNNDSKGEFFDLETENSDTSARGKIVCPDSEITKIWSEVPVIEQVGQTTEVFDHEENTEECEVLNDLWGKKLKEKGKAHVKYCYVDIIALTKNNSRSIRYKWCKKMECCHEGRNGFLVLKSNLADCQETRMCKSGILQMGI